MNLGININILIQLIVGFVILAILAEILLDRIRGAKDKYEQMRSKDGKKEDDVHADQGTKVKNGPEM